MDDNLMKLLEHKEPPRWLVEGLIPLGHLVMFVAKPGAGKSLLLENLMICVATGHDFCGFKTMGGNVIKIDQETTDDDIRSRFRRFLAGTGEKQPRYKFDVRNHSGFYFSSNGILSSTKFRNYIEDARLIVIDSLLSCAGQFDIVKNKEAATVMQIMKKWVSPERTIIFIHHMVKAVDERDILDSAIGFEKFYVGAMAIEAIVDTEFALMPVRKDGELLDKLIIRSKPKRCSLAKHFCKPFVLRLEEDGDKSAKFVYEGTHKDELTEIEANAIMALRKREGECFTDEIAGDLRGLHGEHQVRAALRSLEQKGIAYLAKEAHNTFKWGLTSRGKST